jgi:hypothetical protein
MVAGPMKEKLDQSAMVHGPELIFQIAAGNVPCPALLNIVLGILVRSAQFVKCASGASLLPRLFAHSLYEFCLYGCLFRPRHGLHCSVDTNNTRAGGPGFSKARDFRRHDCTRGKNERATRNLIHSQRISGVGLGLA